MPSRLIRTSTDVFSGIELVKYVNRHRGTEYDDIKNAILGLGLSVVATSVFPPIAAAIATNLGIGYSFVSVVAAIEKGLDDNDLSSTIDRMREGDSLKITTKFYEWCSSNGNSCTLYSDESFRIV